MKVSEVLVAWSCPTLCDPMDCSLPGSSVHGNSPGKNIGVSCCVLLQHIPYLHSFQQGRNHKIGYGTTLSIG